MSQPISFLLLNNENINQQSERFLEDVAKLMCMLRTQYCQQTLLAAIKAQMQQGYQLAVLLQGNEPKTLAGFVISDKLAWRKLSI